MSTYPKRSSELVLTCPFSFNSYRIVMFERMRNMIHVFMFQE
ncbi:hypothetical protein Pat9b_4783 (plasmid) [Pantoea sp. At-9b]|nr:hypothetical protein Pat9b_4783 [Pantoea sp. At-9b]